MKLIHAAFILSFICMGPHTSWSQVGTLDNTFGVGGIVTTDFALGGEDQAAAMALQSDGRIVVVGSVVDGPASVFAVARYNVDGTLDNTFDGDGTLTTTVNGADYAHGVVVQPDGRIVVAGYTVSGNSQDIVVVRYNTDGTLDNTFSGDGVETTSVGLGDWGYGIALQPDGRILVVGASYTSGGSLDFSLVRYNTDGTLDNTFSGDGKVATEFAGGGDQAHVVLVQPDGKIVICGGTQTGTNFDFGAARYNTDGTLDTSFDGDGKVSTSIGTDYDFAITAGLQADGKIVAASTSLSGSNYDYALVRYNTDGSLDPAFNLDGKVTTAIGANWDEGRGLTIQPDGRILLAGFTQGGGFALARYDANGDLDNTFDADGLVTTSIGSIDSRGMCITLQPNGRILVGGFAYMNGTTDFAVVRYGKNLETGIAVSGGVTEAMVVYPDPTTDFATFSFDLAREAMLSLRIVDAGGRIVRTIFSNVKRAAGTHQETMDLSGLAAGNYTLVLDNGHGRASVQLMIE